MMELVETGLVASRFLQRHAYAMHKQHWYHHVPTFPMHKQHWHHHVPTFPMHTQQ